ncbi:MAG: hypothetical protein KBA86_00755 [Bacteroidales bacterium]|nr:hypothetical protein [Bacteroidales bacterium]
MNSYKSTLSQYALQPSLPIWEGKGGVIWGDLEVCSLKTMMFEKHPSISPYTYCANNPMKFVDPTGEVLTDFLNSETGECMHIEDGNDQIVILNNNEYSTIAGMGKNNFDNMSSDQQKQYNKILDGKYQVNMDSKLGKTIRAVYSEMGNLGSSQEDRNVVAASIATRLGMDESKDIDNVLIPSQYNSVTTDTYKNGPYWRENQDAKNAPAFYKSRKQQYDEMRIGSISAAYKALNGLLPSAYDNVYSFVSPPRTSNYFNGNSRLINITNKFGGLKGISGVWKIKQ